ncbi:hypothetical protein V6N13_038574 [Hibiscus sabdariffa]
METFPLGVSWSPPLEGIMSLTMDGVATDAKAGCGGVQRDSSEANWIGKTQIIDESDSKLVLEWIKEKLQRPWRWWKIHHDIDCLATQIKHIKFQHISREHNYLSDFLAKSGMYSSSSFKEWW